MPKNPNAGNRNSDFRHCCIYYVYNHKHMKLLPPLSITGVEITKTTHGNIIKTISNYQRTINELSTNYQPTIRIRKHMARLSQR